MGTTRRAYWRNVWRGRHRRLSPTFIVRRALQIDGIFAWYFVQSGAAHAAAGEERTALRSLIRALLDLAAARGGGGGAEAGDVRLGGAGAGAAAGGAVCEGDGLTCPTGRGGGG